MKRKEEKTPREEEERKTQGKSELKKHIGSSSFSLSSHFSLLCLLLLPLIEKASASQLKLDWELELEATERQTMNAGSFNRLVAALTSYKSLDSDFMKTFITT